MPPKRCPKRDPKTGRFIKAKGKKGGKPSGEGVKGQTRYDEGKGIIDLGRYPPFHGLGGGCGKKGKGRGGACGKKKGSGIVPQWYKTMQDVANLKMYD